MSMVRSQGVSVIRVNKIEIFHMTGCLPKSSILTLQTQIRLLMKKKGVTGYYFDKHFVNNNIIFEMAREKC